MARTDTLPHFLTDVADAIRTKTGESGTIQASTFDTAISNIEGSTYLELDYIEGTGTQYIDTGIAPYQTMIETNFQLTTLTPTGLVQGYTAGVWNPDNNRFYAGQYQPSNNPDLRKFICNDRNNTLTTLGDANLNVHTIIYNDSNNQVLLDGVVKGTVSDLTVQTERNIFLFAMNGSAGPQQYLYGKIFYVKITDKSTNTLLRDFIPVIRLSDKTVCLYDKVSKQFFTNQGTGKFVAGLETL